MEIRQYWQVIVDRIAIVVGTFAVAIVVALASVFLLPQPTSAYQALLSIAVRPQPLPQTPNSFFSQDYYDYVASEYANDDFISVLQGDDFLQTLRGRLQNQPGGAPSGTITGKKAHRVVDITVSSSTASGAMALATTLSDMLVGSNAQSYFSKFTNRIEAVSIVDGPRIVAQPAGRSAILNVLARSLVGLALGVALAFLVEYLDDTIRPSDVEALLGWPLIGEIPGRGVPEPSAKGSILPRTEALVATKR